MTRATIALVTASADTLLWWWLGDVPATAAPSSTSRSATKKARCCRLGEGLGPVRHLAAAANGSRLAACIADTIHIFTLQSEGRPLALPGDHGADLHAVHSRLHDSSGSGSSEDVNAGVFLPQQAHVLLTISGDRCLRLWDTASATLLYRSSILSPVPLTACGVCLAAGRERAAVGDAAGVMRVFDIVRGGSACRPLGETNTARIAEIVAGGGDTYSASSGGAADAEVDAASEGAAVVSIGSVQSESAFTNAAGSGVAAATRAGQWLVALPHALVAVDIDTLRSERALPWLDAGAAVTGIATCAIAENGSACLVAAPFASEALLLEIPTQSDSPALGNGANGTVGVALVGPGRTAAGEDAAPLSLQARTALPSDSPLRAILEPKQAEAKVWSGWQHGDNAVTVSAAGGMKTDRVREGLCVWATSVSMRVCVRKVGRENVRGTGRERHRSSERGRARKRDARSEQPMHSISMT